MKKPTYEPVSLARQMQDDYLAYSMAVIIGRAIPSLTDGLKPVQRRILTAMRWLNLKPDGRYMKSARVEGEVMGKLHPHGSSYGGMVTMAAPYLNNVPFIDGHGNWGSSTDGAAAARYTECKLSPFSWHCLLSDSDTWQTRENYDGSLQEPTELNVKVPAVLLNGQEGIGVGYATKIPPHNLQEICESLADETFVLSPDFPSGCQIVSDANLAKYQQTGSGSLRLRAKLAEQGESGTGKRAKPYLVFTNLPHGTNPEKIGQQIKEQLDKGNLVGITAVSDESDRSGDRIKVTAKPNTNFASLIESLYAYTDLETLYSAKLLVINGNKPVELSPRDLLKEWKKWRMGRLAVHFNHVAGITEKRLNIVSGLLKAISIITKVIAAIRKAETKADAIRSLTLAPFPFNKEQAEAILEMRLRQLIKLDAEVLTKEQADLEATLAEAQALLNDTKKLKAYMIREIKAIGKKYGEPRRSKLIDIPATFAKQKGSPSPRAPIAKPRFLKVDMAKGIITPAKGPRGALMLEKTDKLITLTADGTLKKLSSNYKGPLSVGYSSVLLAKKETEVSARKYLVVFTLEETLKAMTIEGSDLCKTTSKGKALLPANAELVYFGEGTYSVTWESKRKKALILDLKTKAGKPGGKGIKIGNLSEVQGVK